jgi:hypothetical protein
VLEFSQDISLGNIENFGVEDLTVLVDLLDVHLIAEGSDLKLVQESCMSGFNLLTLGDNFLINNDFNLGLDDLGLD